jgi:hypothetical protein
VATSGPSVIGTAAAGKLLTGLSGTWAGFSEISYHFQWHRCNAAGAACASVRGATSPSYRLGEKDVGQTLGLTVLATDNTGTATAYSSLIGPIAPSRPLLESTAQPVVAGPPVQGKIVQVTTGTWSPVPGKLAYRWERCNPNGRSCAAIPRATRSSYTVSGADLGHALLAVVQASNGTTIQNAFSTATPAVVPSTVKGPAPIIGPAVGGYAVVGQQLAAHPGIWKGVGPTSFAYRWYRCDENGAHCALARSSPSTTYPVTAKDAGKTIAVTVRATDSTGAKAAYASLVGPVADAGATLTPTSAPTISGTARVGGALTIATGVWSAQPSVYKMTWLRCNAHGRLCSAIAGATGASYKPKAADTGHTLVASVVASSGGLTQAALTAATAPIT